MSYCERAVVFPCAGEQLLGVVAGPDAPARIGVLIVVGGPQYRAGSHRQFLLLARALAAAGYPAMRFDYRGMGDSSGEARNFEAVEDDIAAALAAFREQCPQLERIVLWGLCDAAAAALLYCDGARDARIGGLVLLNPWVRSEATLARTHLKHYYLRRLMQGEFWRKLLGGQVGAGGAIRGLLGSLRQARHPAGNAGGPQLSFQERMLRGLSGFSGATLVILSGNDYTAKEFIESTKASPAWQAALNDRNVSIREMPDADHTFSTSEWRTAVEAWTLAWLDGMAGAERRTGNADGPAMAMEGALEWKR